MTLSKDMTLKPATAKSGNWEYHLFNAFVFTTVVAMLLAVKFELLHVRCVYAEIGESCKTCGLTRTFTSALNGDFSTLSRLQQTIMILFGSQLLLRPLVSILLIKNANATLVIRFDVLFTIVLIMPYLYLIIN